MRPCLSSWAKTWLARVGSSRTRRHPGRLSLATRSALPPALSTNGGFPLPLALGAGLLVEAALTQLGVESRPLDFSLEPAKGPFEALVLLNDDFQTEIS